MAPCTCARFVPRFAARCTWLRSIYSLYSILCVFFTGDEDEERSTLRIRCVRVRCYRSRVCGLAE